jgi:FAD:protein FMN transferase
MRAAQASSEAGFQRVTVGLGTFVAIQALGAPDTQTRANVLDRACEAFQTVEALMHPTAPGSDLRRIAEAPGEALLSIHPWTFEVLSLSLRLWRSSGGHFDPYILSIPPRRGALNPPAPDSVRTPSRPALLDLGGIAKGFAIDRAVDVLIEHGCSTGLVNAGGDVRAFGPQEYEIDLQIPDVARRLRLAGRALAVSAPKSARSPSEHRGFYSRVTGVELPGRAVGVLAPTAAVADALTKCALACMPDDLRRLLDEFSASLLALD